ncbi:MAG TPA: O-antigen ligase family protein [Pirellulaceae bacterium]|nr:O-antigen ligase family protein [Pirellulaceae bacterium]
MDFVVFVLVNAALFLRPQDLIPDLAEVPIYNVLIVFNLVVAAPHLVRELRSEPRRSPATICVVAILVAAVLSLLIKFDWRAAWQAGLQFAKVGAYFLLITAVLRSPRRYTTFLALVVILTTVLAAIAVAHFHGQLNVAAITHAREVTYDAATGDQSSALRLSAFGVFADPNDLSMVVVLSILIGLGGICYPKLGMLRVPLIGVVLFLGYTLALTQSRGGLLALVAGLGAFVLCRYGVSRMSLALVALVPLLFVVFGGRQADISGGIASGTGSSRTDLWYAGLQMIKWQPLWGVGHGRFVEHEGLVAHSSYLQALAEWGVLGGAMFVGLFYVVLYSIWRLRRFRPMIGSGVLRSFHPFVLGALAAYATSMLTLTRCEVVPTYLVAGLGVSYERLARRNVPLRPLEFTPQLFSAMLGVSLAYLAVLYVFIRFIYRMF